MADEVRMIKLSKIVVPEHMRKHSPEKTAELAKDIKVRGQLQDAVVTPMDDGNFELLAGGNRYAAMKLNGAEEIRCLVKENVSPYERSCITLSENLKREDMSPVDLGLELKRAMETGNKTQEELAKDLGLTQGYISQYVTAAELSEPVREIINRLIIGIAHINPIARLAGDAAKIAMLEKIEKEDLSVKQVENLVNKALASSPDPAGQAEAVKQADGAAAAKPKPVAKGVKCVKAGKGFHLAGGFKDLIPMDDFLKAAREAYQPLLDEQAQQAQAEQSKPDPQALKAANDIKKAAKVQITKLKKQLKTALAHLKSQQTSNRDTSGALKDVESIKVDIEAQKLKLKTLDKNPAGVAAKLALPVDPGSEEPTAAKQASQLQDTTGQHQDNLKKAVESGLLGEKGKAIVQFREKMAELIKLQLAHKTAGSEEDKARLAAEIEKKKAEIEELKNMLNGEGRETMDEGRKDSGRQGVAKTAGDPSKDIATLPPPEAIKSLSQMGNKIALQQLKAAIENPNPERALQYEAQLKAMGLTKEQYIALLDAELK